VELLQQFDGAADEELSDRFFPVAGRVPAGPVVEVAAFRARAFVSVVDVLLGLT
jgi:hypothetical protein